MIETFCLILFIILISRVTEELTRIPSSLYLLLFALLVSNIFPNFFSLSPQMFDQVLHLLLPIVLLPVILSLSLEEIRRSYRALIFLAVVAVVLSIGLAVLVTPLLLPRYDFSAGMLFALFSMLMATDAVTLTSIFTHFNLPERLKLYAEGESLFNDVTALILFYFIALPLIGGSYAGLSAVNLALFKVLVLSCGTGFAIAAAGFLAVKVLKDPLEQFIIIYLVALVAFLAAEHFNVSGLLAVITSLTSLRILIDREIRERRDAVVPEGVMEDVESFTGALLNVIRNVPAMTRKGFRAYRKEAVYISVFANAILFISMANMVRIDRILKYSSEIAIIFLVTTTIRFLVINGMHFFFQTPYRWNMVLTFSGVKGGLTIIMAHSLPLGFVHREMFETVVLGVVLLSTFLYTFGAMAVLRLYRHHFKDDRVRLHAGQEIAVDLKREIRTFLEKDPLTGAYEQIMLQDFLSREVARANRYKLELSLIGIEFQGNAPPDSGEDEEPWNRLQEGFGRVVREKIRTNDYFCRNEGWRYVIVATNTPVDGALSLTSHIRTETALLLARSEETTVYYGITEYAMGDTGDILMEKLDCSLEKARRAGGGETGVEL